MILQFILNHFLKFTLMKQIFTLINSMKALGLMLCLLPNLVSGQTAVPMASQGGLSYTENFTDIANWTNGFAAGTGANR